MTKTEPFGNGKTSTLFLDTILAVSLDDGAEGLIDISRVDPDILATAIRRGLAGIIDDRIAELREQSLADIAIREMMTGQA